jgi:hypothetical protein
LCICAEAAIERINAGAALSEVTPFWRVIEPGSTIARKLSVDAHWIAHQRDIEAS